MDIYFILWVLIQYYFILLLKLSQRWPLGALALSRTPLLSGTRRCSRIIVHISCPSPRISHFPKESWFLFLQNGIRNQVRVLGALTASVEPVLFWFLFCFICPGFPLGSPFPVSITILPSLIRLIALTISSEFWEISQVCPSYYWSLFFLARTLLSNTSNADFNSAIWYLVFSLVLWTSFSILSHSKPEICFFSELSRSYFTLFLSIPLLSTLFLYSILSLCSLLALSVQTWYFIYTHSN